MTRPGQERAFVSYLLGVTLTVQNNKLDQGGSPTQIERGLPEGDSTGFPLHISFGILHLDRLLIILLTVQTLASMEGQHGGWELCNLKGDHGVCRNETPSL